MAEPRKGPKVKRLDRIAERYSGKPREALVAAVDALNRIQLGGEDCALGGNHTDTVELLGTHGLLTRLVLCQKRVSSAVSNCYACEGTGNVAGHKCAECNGTGTWYRCKDCGGSGRRGRNQCQNCGGAGFKPRSLYEEAARATFSVDGKQYTWDVSTQPQLSVPVSGRTAQVLNRQASKAELPKNERLEARDLADWVLRQFQCGALILTAEDARTLAASGESPERTVACQPGPSLIVAKVAGVAHPNHDGSSRQRFIAECRSGDAVHFRREPGNAFDQNAVMVMRASGGQLGYLPAEVASEIAPQMDRGVSFVGCIERIAIWDDGTRGLDIVLQVAPPARGLLGNIRSWFS